MRLAQKNAFPYKKESILACRFGLNLNSMFALRSKFSASRADIQAFSITQTLVAISIAAVLIAILVPAISSAMSKANMAADLGKLKTIGVAVAQYTAEQGAYPRTIDAILINGDGNLTKGLGWEAIDRYMPPMPGFNPRTQANFWNGPGRGGGRDCWYAKNAKQPVGKTNMHMPFALNPMVVDTSANNLWADKRSRLVLMAEVNTRGAMTGLNPNMPVTYMADEVTGVTSGYRASHPGKKGLFLFCDFHIEALEGDQSMLNPSRKVLWSHHDATP